jgi:NAD(P)-dependent dehydrogenase (short-subunit alcohol dehydrogenase family)
MAKTAVVAGVGPGLSESVVRKFADEGCAVGMFARSEEYLADLESDLRDDGADALAASTDIMRPDDVESSFDEVRSELGSVDVPINNAGNYLRGGLLDISPDDFERMWRVAAYGSFLCSQEAVPDMLENSSGTVIFTGATSAVRGSADGLAFGAAKFAVRGMTESMARDLGPDGIHVSHVIIDGMIDMPTVRENFPDMDDEELLDPDAIANSY